MLQVKQHIKTYFTEYFKKTNTLSSDIFKFNMFNDDLYISNIFASLIYKHHHCNMHNRRGIKLMDLYEEIKLLKDYKYIPSQIIVGLVNIIPFYSCNICIGSSMYIRKQTLFTYSLQTCIEKYDLNILFKVEDNFLSHKRFDDMHIEKSTGPRPDIIFDDLKLVIEYDESHHNSSKQTIDDIKRDEIINALQYKVLRFRENNDIKMFIENEFLPIINHQIFLNNPSKLPEYIVKLFCDKGHEPDHVNMLVKSQCIDIVNGCEYDAIGTNPTNITVSILLCSLQMGDDDVDCVQDILESCDDPYIDNIDPSLIVLSPNAMEYLLDNLTVEQSPVILQFRKLYREIKKTFLYHTFTSTIELSLLQKDTVQTLINITNSAYERCNADNFAKSRKKEALYNDQNKKLLLYEQVFENMLTKNCRGVIRKPLPIVLKKLKHGKAIIPELPQLVYSNENADYINKNDIQMYVDINIRLLKYGNVNSPKAIIAKLLEKLNIPTYEYNNSNIIQNCKWINVVI